MEPVQACARQQLDLAAFDAGVHALAVVLNLMQPVVARWRLVYQARELRLDPLGGRDVVPTMELQHIPPTAESLWLIDAWAVGQCPAG